MDIEQEAKLQGWVPQEAFKGNQEKWVDAETYVERGKAIMPILQNNNKRLLAEQDKLKAELETLKATVSTQSQSMEELKKFHEESSKAQVEKARRDLLAELKTAKAEGDIDAEIQAQSDLSRFDAAQQSVKEQPKQQTPQQTSQPTEPQIQPYVEAWMRDNPWYGQDMERTDMMDAVAFRLKRERTSLKERDFLEEAARIVNERLAPEKQTPHNKVESYGRGEATEAKSGGYSKLPPEAKAQCDKDAEKYVGEHKVYKTKKEWQEFYASEYFKR